MKIDFDSGLVYIEKKSHFHVLQASGTNICAHKFVCEANMYVTFPRCVAVHKFIDKTVLHR